MNYQQIMYSTPKSGSHSLKTIVAQSKHPKQITPDVCKILMNHWAVIKILVTFHDIGESIGTLVMAYHNRLIYLIIPFIFRNQPGWKWSLLHYLQRAACILNPFALDPFRPPQHGYHNFTGFRNLWKSLLSKQKMRKDQQRLLNCSALITSFIRK